jgi:dienelactone hydrolase
MRLVVRENPSVPSRRRSELHDVRRRTRTGLVGWIVTLVLLLFACSPLEPLTETHIETVDFESLSFPGALWDPFMPPASEGTPTTVSGLLTIPPTETPVPAVVITHGCGGILASTASSWSLLLSEAGIATFVVNSFAGRGITEICSGRETVNLASMVYDVFRAVEALQANPYIDGSRIVTLGFSFGGRTALWAAIERFQELYDGPAGGLAGYLAFYPASCYIRLEGEERVNGGPIRIFHGTADDWLPIDHCRAYVERMQEAGVDAFLFEYPDAHHAFDDASLNPMLRNLSALSPRNCEFVERDGAIIDPETGEIGSTRAPCVEAGVSAEYDPAAHEQSKQDVLRVLEEIFSR